MLVNVLIMRLQMTADRPFAQPWLVEFGFDASGIAYVYAGVLAAAALAARLAQPLARVLGNDERRELALLCGLGVVGALAFARAPVAPARG